MVKNNFVRQNKIVILRAEFTSSAWKNLAAISCRGKKRQRFGGRPDSGCPESRWRKMAVEKPSSPCHTILLEFYRGVCYAKEGWRMCRIWSLRSDGKPNISAGLRCVRHRLGGIRARNRRGRRRNIQQQYMLGHLQDVITSKRYALGAKF